VSSVQAPERRRVPLTRALGALVIALALFLAFVTPVRVVCEGTVLRGQSYPLYCGPDHAYQAFVLVIGAVIGLLLIMARRRHPSE
jgi:uncharacterized membrane protein YidH (DUF202 family)